MQVVWLSHPKTASVITRGVSHGTSSFSLLCLVITCLECHTTPEGGLISQKNGGVTTTQTCHDLTNFREDPKRFSKWGGY